MPNYRTYGGNPYGGADWGMGDQRYPWRRMYGTDPQNPYTVPDDGMQSTAAQKSGSAYDATWGSIGNNSVSQPNQQRGGQEDAAKTSGSWGGLTYGQWAELIAGLYAADRNSKPGEWRQAPETPEQAAMRRQLIHYTQPGGSPTRSMLGNMLAPRVENLGQGAPAGYKPINYDIKGILSGIDRATPQDFANSPASAPPPPPDVYRSSFGERVADLGEGAVGGAARGIGGGAVGMFAGALGGIFSGRRRYRQHEDRTRKEYDAWLQQYGNSFTDAQGNQVAAPRNMKEYEAWYQRRYGVPYKPPQQAGGKK